MHGHADLEIGGSEPDRSWDIYTTCDGEPKCRSGRRKRGQKKIGADGSPRIADRY